MATQGRGWDASGTGGLQFSRHPAAGFVVDQITGGIVFGLTAVLKSRITMTRGRVDQRNFDTFALLRMDEMPDIKVHLVGSAHPPTGIGEAAVPLAGPALANAVYAATGKRICHLPICPDNMTNDKRSLLRSNKNDEEE
jgi:CO/xanthine dehydrogenase Mo-binding subunit